jgi:hypothetical protein
MKVWEFDRPGGIASKQFDINKDDNSLYLPSLGFVDEQGGTWFGSD